MSEHKLRKIAFDEITLDNAAEIICEALKSRGCIVLVLNEDKTIGMTSHQLNHYKANELLSVGIHINLGQMDDAIRDGFAGKTAQSIQLVLDGGRA